MCDMSFSASVVRVGFKLSGIKKVFGLPEDRLLEKINKLNRGRDFFVPCDGDFDFEDRVIGEKYHCLVIKHKG